jgi:N-acetyl-gamma-glutamyl-phosphate reductase
LIANPGCYATAILLGLLPLLNGKTLIQADSLAIDAKSGTSGAGKKGSENLLFTEVEGNCMPYRVGCHQHLPEIQRTIERITEVPIEPFFVTSLLPVRRGIIASIFAKLQPGIGLAEIEAAFSKAYQGEPLIQFGKASGPSGGQLLSLRRVVGTARTHISFEVTDNKLYLFVTIDNLLKGAAGQAIENMNRMLGWNASLGLTSLEGIL